MLAAVCRCWYGLWAGLRVFLTKQLFVNINSGLSLSCSRLLGALIVNCTPRNWNSHRCDYVWSLQPVDPCSAQTLIIRNCHNKSNWWYSLCRFPSQSLLSSGNSPPCTCFSSLVQSTTGRERLKCEAFPRGVYFANPEIKPSPFLASQVHLKILRPCKH